MKGKMYIPKNQLDGTALLKKSEPDTIELLDEQIRLLLKEFLMEFLAAVAIALFHRGRVDFDQVIRRYSKKILKLKTGNKDNR